VLPTIVFLIGLPIPTLRYVPSLNLTVTRKQLSITKLKMWLISWVVDWSEMNVHLYFELLYSAKKWAEGWNGTMVLNTCIGCVVLKWMIYICICSFYVYEFGIAYDLHLCPCFRVYWWYLNIQDSWILSGEWYHDGTSVCACKSLSGTPLEWLNSQHIYI